MYCDRCGSSVPAGAKFCPSCGTEQKVVSMANGESRLARHLRLLGILWMASASLHLLAGLAAWMAGRFLLPRILSGSVVGFVPVIVSVVGIFIMAVASVAFVAGWGLLQHEPWGRTLALILAFLALFKPPFGTALGIYTLWALLPAQAEQEYRRFSRAA